MQQGPGKVEMDKWHDDYDKGLRDTWYVPGAWRPNAYIQTPGRGGRFKSLVAPDPPYGDNPIDHNWIKNGFEYYWDYISD